MEKEIKRFENRMLIILIVTTILSMVAISILPISNSMSDGEKLRQFLVMGIIVVVAFLSNTINIVAIALKKNN